MNLSKNKSLLSVLALCWVVTACSSNDDEAEDTMNSGGETAVFAFSTDAPDTFARVDRAGMPAISTALIASKDDYNQSNPIDDSAGKFVPEILASLEFLHGALDEQLISADLTPCTYLGDGMGTCAVTAVPLIIPDTLKIDTAVDAGFPNGRMLSDPVIDVTLAVALLELTGETPPHTALDLVGVLNPAANDKEFLAVFPFVAAPHQ